MIHEEIKRKDLTNKESLCLYYLYIGKIKYADELISGYNGYDSTKLVSTLTDKGYIVPIVPLVFTNKTIDAFGEGNNIVKSTTPSVNVMSPLSNSCGVYLLTEYRKLFKDAFRSRMGSKTACSSRLSYFLSKHDYTDKQILDATKNYIDSQRSSGYKYLLKAENFINNTREDKVTKELLINSRLLQELEGMNFEKDNSTVGGGTHEWV